jgi:DNA-directed RNA polymerase specialized sigma subunit
LTRADEEAEGVEIDIIDDKTNDQLNKLTLEDIFAVCETEQEKEILSILLKDNEISQEEIAKQVGLSQQVISLIIQGLRKKLKKDL